MEEVDEERDSCCGDIEDNRDEDFEADEGNFVMQSLVQYVV